MANRAQGLFGDYLDNRWTYTDSQVNATIAPTMVAAPQSSKEQRHLDYLSIVVLNKSAAASTVTVSVRDASVAGTVIAQYPLLPAAAGNLHLNPANIHLLATVGKGIFATQDTVVTSVVVAVNAGGWTDQSEY